MVDDFAIKCLVGDYLFSARHARFSSGRFFNRSIIQTFGSLPIFYSPPQCRQHAEGNLTSRQVALRRHPLSAFCASNCPELINPERLADGCRSRAQTGGCNAGIVSERRVVSWTSGRSAPPVMSTQLATSAPGAAGRPWPGWLSPPVRLPRRRGGRSKTAPRQTLMQQALAVKRRQGPACDGL